MTEWAGSIFAQLSTEAASEAAFAKGLFGPISPVERALIALGLGHPDVALSGLEEAYAAHLPGTLIAGDPFFSELASERRYQN